MLNPQQWTAQFGSTVADVGEAIIFDETSGLLYLTGYTAGNLEGNTNSGVSDDAWFAAYNLDGTRNGEVVQFGSSLRDRAHDLVTNSEGDLFITGETSGDLDPDFGVNNQGSSDIWIRRYDPDARSVPPEEQDPIWTAQLGSSERDFSNSITIDSQGNLYITGYTEGSLATPNQGLSDIWVAKYTPEGEQAWVRQFGTSEREESFAIATDNNDNVYLTGTTYGSLGGVNAGETDIWAASYDSNGNQRWLQQFGGNSTDHSYGIAVDSNDDIYLTGFTRSLLEGGNPLGSDPWVAKLNGQSGGQTWLRQFDVGDVGSDLNVAAFAVAVDSEDNAIVTGNSFIGSDRDIWLAAFDPEGNIQEEPTLFGSEDEDDFSNDLAIDNNNNIYTVGNIGLETNTGNTDSDADIVINQTGRTADGGPEPEPLNNPPVVEDDTFTLDTDVGNGTLVGLVAATDSENDSFVFSFDPDNLPTDVDGDGNLPFVIDENNGAITVNDSDDIDAKLLSSFTFNVIATETDTEEMLSSGDDPEPPNGQITVDLQDNLQQYILIENDQLPPSREPDPTVNLPTTDAAPLDQNIYQDDLLSFDVFYEADLANLAGLGLRLHYDSTKLTFDEFDDDFLLNDGLLQQSSTPQEDTEDFDNDPDTDRFVNVLWTGELGADDWPGQTPVQLYRVNFRTAPNLFASEQTGGTDNNETPQAVFAPPSALVPLENTIPPNDNTPLVITNQEDGENSDENPIRDNFDSETLLPNDDGSTGLVPLGFTVDFFGQEFDQAYVNNNGNITFDQALATFTPFDITSTGREILAPFFADVDTRNTQSGVVTYGQGTVDDRAAFGVNWIDVGYFSQRVDKLNDFQLVLIDRSDTGENNFDIEFNYESIEWETGEASGGTDGLGGSPARAGYSNGTGEPGTFFELDGSAQTGAFLDSNENTGLANISINSDVEGRVLFEVRNGIVQNPEALNLTTSMNFSVSSQAGNVDEVVTQSGLVTFTQYNYDIDGNGEINALTDGRLILRFLFGFDGEELVNTENGTVIASDATRTTAEEIELYLNQGAQALDVDGNGQAEPLTDGIVINRLMAGFEGDDLIEDAVAPDATRTTAEEILAFINERSYNEITTFAEQEDSVTVEDAEFSIDENSVVDSEVGQVNATNANDSPLTYEITEGNTDIDGDDNTPFTINTETGLITVNDSEDLDFETSQNVFDLTVAVTNEEGDIGTGNVQVNINDVEEEPPEPPEPPEPEPNVIIEERTIAINENLPTGFEVGTFNIFDINERSITLEIIDGNEDNDNDDINAFNVEFDSIVNQGKIIVQDQDEIDFEIEEEFTLEVEATNVNTEEAIGTGEITIQLNDLEEPNSLFPPPPNISEENETLPELTSYFSGETTSELPTFNSTESLFPDASLETSEENSPLNF